METLDVVEHIGLGRIQGQISLVVDALTFQHPEEALARRVIAAVADSTHRAQQRMAFEQALIITTEELAAVSECKITEPLLWRCQMAMSTAPITMRLSWR